VHGVSTRSVDDLIKAMGMTGISKSQVSRLCEETRAHGQTSVPGTDDDCGDSANGGRSQASAATAGGSIHYHRDIGRVGHDVIDRRSLLRLRNQRFDVFAFCIGVDLVGHLDAAESITNVVVYAENALDVHVPLYGRRD